MQVLKDVSSYEKKYPMHIVVKDFFKMGSALRSYTKDEADAYSKTMLRCGLNTKGNTQVVALHGDAALSVYAEYAPYYVCDTDAELLECVLTGDVPGTPLRSHKM